MALQLNSPVEPVFDDRLDFYKRIGESNLAPLWESLHLLVTREPQTPVKPYLWDYDNIIRPWLLEAGQLITAEEAERRVLILENPGLRGLASATHSLYAGVQMVLPGEVAPAHRHSQSALRFIVESTGGYTTVEGERVFMYPGDFVTTPNWTWHDHGNTTDDPIIWVDVLDVPLVRLLDGSFSQISNIKSRELERPRDDSQAVYGQNMFPVDWELGASSSPIFHYPYSRSRESLAGLQRRGDPDACHGYKLRYVNPANGASALSTIGAFMQLLPAGFRSAPYRSTDAAIYVVVEGEGETQVGDTVLAWKPRDVFVVPSWALHSHKAQKEAVLFSASDRPVQQKLDLWREERRV
jgi:gentisate 1,2-dioxygenase